MVNDMRSKIAEVNFQCGRADRLISHVDKKLSEHYHKVETAKFNVVEGYYLAKELQFILQERKIISDKRSKVYRLRSSLMNTKKVRISWKRLEGKGNVCC